MGEPATDHVDDDTAVALLGGALDAPRADAVRAHAARCEACREHLANLARVLSSGTGSARALEPRRLREGDLVGRYRLHRRIGHGGMGEVWAASDPRLDREVALKFLRADLDPAYLGSITEEAALLAQVSHPNVVAVFEVVHQPAGAALVMELVPGETLLQWQRRPGRATEAIVAYYRQALAGLAAAHAVGVTHGDFKPHNVLVANDGRARVLDFGLASFVAITTGGGGTGRTSPRGTAAYMAPELWSGRAADAASDQFSFCVALWEALSGARPFAGDGIESLRNAVLAGHIQPPPRPLPRAIAAVLRRGLELEPGRRFVDLAALDAALAHATRRRWLALGAALGAATLVLSMAAQMRVDDDPCDGVDDSRIATWDHEAAAIATRRLIDVAGDDYQRPAGFVTRAVTRAVERWRTEHASACEPPRELGRDRRACLERQRAKFLRWFDALDDVDLTRTTADTLAAALPQAADCGFAHDEPLEGSFDAELRRRLSETSDEIDDDVSDGGRARAHALLLQARDGGSAVTRARAEAVWGYALMRDHEYAAALEVIAGANLAAVAAGDRLLDGETAKVATSLAVELGLVDEARRWLRHFESAGDPESPDFAAEVHTLAADIAYLVRDLDTADRELAQALAMTEPDSRARARPLGLWGRRLLEGGALHEAVDAYSQMREFSATHFGPRSPDMVTVLEGLGLAHAALGESRQAREAFDEARSIALQRWGTDSERYDELIGNYAQALEFEGDLQTARDLLAAVIERRRRRQGAADANLIAYDVVLARFEQRLGNHRAAIEALDEAASIEQSVGSRSSFQAMSTRAEALRGLGENDAALAVFDEAQQVAGDDVDRNMIELGRARTLAAKRDWAAAAVAITRAQGYVAALDDDLALRRSDMERVAALIALRTGDRERARASIARAREALARSGLPDDRGIEVDLRACERELDALTDPPDSRSRRR